MISFPFTRKKFLSLPLARRQKWLRNWFKEIYIQILEEKISLESLQLLARQYRLAMHWIDEPCPTFPEQDNLLFWKEFIADCFHKHQLATGLGLAESDFLPQVNVGDQPLDTPYDSTHSYHVALDNLRSAFNVGSIFRTMDGAGFESLVLGGSTPGKEHHQVQKTSMGTSQWILEEKVEDLSQTLQRKKEGGISIIGVETVENSWSYLDFPWPKQAILVMGNEEYGISQSVLSVCDSFVHLPMYGKKNSINVANAFAVMAFHIAAQLKEKQE